LFHDRTSAGRRLGEVLAERELVDPVVLALPRGGVPVASAVAEGLDAPLDVLVVRKVGAPGQPEFAIGAIAEGGTLVEDADAVELCGVRGERFEQLVAAERRELDRRVLTYRGGRPLPPLEGRDVVVVDDGLATGATAEAAVRAAWTHRPRSVLMASPVCSSQASERVLHVATEVVCIDEPTPFVAVGRFYERFDQTSDGEVVALLEKAARRRTPPPT
jgi:putative phosphoribosyl transferase